MRWVTERHREVIAGLAWIAAALVVAGAVHHALHVPAMGIDIVGARHAAEALLDGRNVYGDPTFVYPPSAAALFLPVTVGSLHSAQTAWICVLAAALTAAAVVAVSPLGRRGAPVAGAAAVVLLLGSDLARDSLGLGNASVLMAPVAVLVLLLFERERWTAGCALLMTSLLLKPLLAPLIVLPVLRSRWRALLYTGVPFLVVIGISLLVVPGASHAPGVFRNLSVGGVLVGHGAVYNLSLHGLGERLDQHSGVLVSRALVAASVVAMLMIWRRRGTVPGTTVATGVGVLVGWFLAGSMSETHWVLATLPCLLLAVALTGQRRALLVAAPALGLAFLPRAAIPRAFIGGVGDSPEALQLRYLAVEILMFLASMAIVTASERRSRRTLPLNAASARSSAG